MPTAIPRSAWVTLYKQLQREAAKFPQYNYRVFAQRRVRDHFEKNRQVTDPTALTALYQKGQENLDSLRRQVAVSGIFPHKKTVVEEQVDAAAHH